MMINFNKLIRESRRCLKVEKLFQMLHLIRMLFNVLNQNHDETKIQSLKTKFSQNK